MVVSWPWPWSWPLWGSLDHSPGGEGGSFVDPLESLDSYLELAEECAKDAEAAIAETYGVQKMPSPEFNNKQCEYLALKLEVVVRSARIFFSELLFRAKHDRGSHSLGDVARYISLFKFLLALAKQIQGFIQNCCRDLWIQAAITLINVEEYVSALGFNLELLKVVFAEERSRIEERSTLDRIRDIHKNQVKIVKRRASSDLEALLKKVRSIPRNSPNDGDRELAGFLLQRLERVHPISPSVSARPSLGTINDDDVLRDLFKLVEPTELLGRGAVCSVHKAMWLGTEVAKKTFFGVGQEDPQIMRETAILAKLCHPNITSTFSSVMDRPGFSVLMELMDESLFSVIRRRLETNKDSPPFSIMESIDIMLQVGEGVNYLHNNHIAHRDLKSFKILVKNLKARKLETGYVQVKVADFGLSFTKRRQLTNLTFNRGTNRWMPPESIRSSSRNERRQQKDLYKCDAYSFGMVCYEILTGDLPFSTIHGSREITRMVMNGMRPSLPDHCPLTLKDLIMKCWDSNPLKRPSFSDICWELKYMKYQFMRDFSFNHDTRLTAEKPVQASRDQAPAPFSEPFISLRNGRQVGRGASATVYEVDWQGRKCAKKTFYGLNVPDFSTEVSILGGLSHPNIMSLLYSGRDKQSCFLVMDLMDGDLFVTMQNILNESGASFPFTIRIAVDIMHQVAQGVNYLHENKIVHSDLKAGNILVKRVRTTSGPGNLLARVAEHLPSIAKYFKCRRVSVTEMEYFLAKVADFGLAKTKTKSKTTSEQVANAGSNRHMAPEIISLTPGQKLHHEPGQKSLPFKCDVYSFAMLCYEILTGNKPFPNEDDDKVVKTMVIEGKRPELPSYCPPELKALITKCWNHTPSDRPKFETICVELEHLKASLETDTPLSSQKMTGNASSTSAGKGTKSIYERDSFAPDPWPKDKYVGCIPCTWPIVSAAILVALAILLALVMLGWSQALISSVTHHSREDRLSTRVT